MSGTSAIWRRSFRTKSNKKIPFFTPSKIKVWEIESLKRGQDTMPIEVSALEKRFLFISFLNESIWYLRFCKGWYLGSSCFLTDWVIKHLLYTEAGMRTKCSMSKKWFLMGWVIILLSCKSFLKARRSLLHFQFVPFRDNSRTPLWTFATWCFLMLCRFPLRRFLNIRTGTW